jgi:hypothetical protein
VGVAGDEHPIAGVARREDHGLVAAGGAVDQKVRAVGAVGLGGELLGFLDDASGFVERVDFVEGGQVDREDLRPEELAKPGREALAALEAGRVEPDLATLRQRDHRVEQRSPELFIKVHHDSVGTGSSSDLGRDLSRTGTVSGT